MRIAERPDELEDAAHAAMREAEKAFGDGRVYLERLIVMHDTLRSRSSQMLKVRSSISVNGNAVSNAVIRRWSRKPLRSLWMTTSVQRWAKQRSERQRRWDTWELGRLSSSSSPMAPSTSSR